MKRRWSGRRQGPSTDEERVRLLRIHGSDTVIVLIFVGWLPTVQGCVLPALSTIARGGVKRLRCA